MATISIVGYEQEGHCEHCGRALKHCIRISDGRLVGATCFDKKLTKVKNYQGRNYRVGSENVIRAAKVAANYTREVAARRFGMVAGCFDFEAA